jgi:hypothetical protein
VETQTSEEAPGAADFEYSLDLRTNAMIQKDVHTQIEGMIGRIKCPKDFVCYTSEFKSLCRAKDIGLESFVACLATDPLKCKFSIHFGGIFFCQCMLRIYIAKKLKK